MKVKIGRMLKIFYSLPDNYYIIIAKSSNIIASFAPVFYKVFGSDTFFYVFRQVGLKVQSVRQQKRPGEVFVSGNEALLTSDATAAWRERFTRRIPEQKNSSDVVSVTGGVKGLLRRGGAGGPTWLQNFQLLCGSGG